jgi:signal transduction histidine kinase
MTEVLTAAALAGWALAALAGAGLAQARVRAARAAHEVRGPLCAARLALDGATARGAAIDLELRRAARALDALTGTPPVVREAVDAGALVRAAAPALRATAEAHGAALQVDVRGPGWVRGDPVRLAQAVANLVANAAEHGGGTVRVAVRGDAARVRVSVADDGAGLPRPLAELLAGRSRAGRRGHGLRVVAAVAAEHGARLRTLPGARLELELPALRHGVLRAAERGRAA